MSYTIVTRAKSVRSSALVGLPFAVLAIGTALGPVGIQAQQSRDGAARGPSYSGQRASREATAQTTEGNGDTNKKREPPAPPPKSTGIAAQAEHKKPGYDQNRFVLSPDAKRIALAGAHIARDAAGKIDKLPTAKPPAPFVEVIEVATGRSLAVFNDGAAYDNLALSPSGDFLAAEDVARRGTFKVWHIPTKKAKELPLATRVLAGGVAFSPDNRSLYLLSPTGIKMAPLAGGAAKEMKFESPVVSANYCAANNLVAVGVSRSGYGKIEIQVYDVATQKPVKTLGMPRLPSVVQFTSDGKFLGAALAGGALGVWQTSDWIEVGSTFNAFGFDPAQIAVAPDGLTVAVRPKSPRGNMTEVVDIKSGEKKTPLIARDVFYLPTGIIALSNVEGPHYFDPAGAVALALPPAPAADPNQVADAASAPATQANTVIAPQPVDPAVAEAARLVEATLRAQAAAAQSARNAPRYPNQPAYPIPANQPGKEQAR